MEQLFTLVLAVGFAIIHFTSKYMRFLEVVPRSRFLSAAGGIAVAYVFLHILPELNEHQERVGHVSLFKKEIYVFAMVSLAIFYGLEKMVTRDKSRNVSKGTFWVHMTSFTIYNALIGYLLAQGEFEGVKGLLFYFIAMAVHFIANDHGLYETHKESYNKRGRWVLSVAILAGWFIGVSTKIHESAVAFLFAFIAGGTILNVMKEELPEEKESDFRAFFAGLFIYSLLLTVKV
ncbi:zinc transporter ZupT [Bacillus ectoiniformans]|uniref:hypothetical protein n=1 Tax=Bacillus ectoiniformans TaxID=1494429 RepID=UPI001958549F|nr:hypothetical protein [Bacillus ectoiniformans]MBM7648296.1 zinc transporter ZupT [Bacillus ectoiniformans]